MERDIANLLTELGVIFEYETHKLAYQIQHHYKPDFILANGVILESKGYWEPEDRRKIKAVTEQNPDLDIRMVFQNPNNTISRKSKTTYGQWCDKHDIPWCSYTTIPIDWLV